MWVSFHRMYQDEPSLNSWKLFALLGGNYYVYCCMFHFIAPFLHSTIQIWLYTVFSVIVVVDGRFAGCCWCSYVVEKPQHETIIVFTFLDGIQFSVKCKSDSITRFVGKSEMEIFTLLVFEIVIIYSFSCL